MHNVNVQKNSGASNGGTIFSDTASHSGNWFRIEALSAATFTTLTGNVTGIASNTLPAGSSLYGSFTVVELAGGAVVAYNN